jgi:polyisoprenoid-binding protein YceI
MDLKLTKHKFGNEYNVTGDLTMHGVTHPVVLRAEYNKLGKDPWGQQRVGLSARTKVNRKDWGLVWNVALETGGVLVSEDINIEIDLSAVNKG